MKRKLLTEFQDKDYRHGYANDFMNTSMAAQIKALRESRGLTQKQLADLCGMKQSRISVLEDVNYSRWSAVTLFRIARALDVALVVKFASFDSVAADAERFSIDALIVPPFDDSKTTENVHA